jgi:cyclopropane fatty-acyl-phospholipid synthase-like methyltransferase
MTWDKTYRSENKVWGESPSMLAVFAYTFLTQSTQFRGNQDLFILDIGCGYGRDALFLARNLPCHVLGVDNSEKAIEIAQQSVPGELKKKVELLCYDFSRVNDRYDIILASNLYQILKQGEREQLRETIQRCLNSNSLLFLSTLSVRDPHHSGKGSPVENDPNSFIQDKYVHLSTREELEKDFDFLNINALFEREYVESHSSGNSHHHISWLLVGGMK